MKIDFLKIFIMKIDFLKQYLKYLITPNYKGTQAPSW